MKWYAYNAYLRFAGIYDSPEDCPPHLECTQDEPPTTPWPDGHWPFFLDSGWELVAVNTS